MNRQKHIHRFIIPVDVFLGILCCNMKADDENTVDVNNYVAYLLAVSNFRTKAVLYYLLHLSTAALAQKFMSAWFTFSLTFTDLRKIHMKSH